MSPVLNEHNIENILIVESQLHVAYITNVNQHSSGQKMNVNTNHILNIDVEPNEVTLKMLNFVNVYTIDALFFIELFALFLLNKGFINNVDIITAINISNIKHVPCDIAYKNGSYQIQEVRVIINDAKYIQFNTINTK